MAFDVKVFAANLKRFRTEKAITQQTLGEKLMISPQAISKWECAQAVPELDKLCTLAEVLGVSVDALVNSQPVSRRVLIGVDGGGTKTEFILFGEDGTLYKRLVLEGSNPNVHGLESSLRVFREGIDSLLEGKLHLAGLHIGCAGFPTGGYGEKVKAALQERFPKAKITCTSDIMNIIATGSDSYHCIAAISGTGSVVYANDNRTLHRHGGGGYLLDKLGSGFDIGRDVLRTAFMERDGVGEESLITPLAEKRLGCTVWEAVPEIYKQGNAFIASFSRVAFDAYRQGDKVAERILREHAEYLAKLIQVAAKKHDCGKTVVLSGSIFIHNPDFLELLKEYITIPLNIEVPQNPPVFGACVLACENCGIATDGLARQFAARYEAFLTDNFTKVR